jgi:hypothetical protein
MTATSPRPPHPLPPPQGLIILSCSREKLVTSQPVPAWALYQGACVPQARDHFAAHDARRARVRILSAAHGLLRPDDQVTTYERHLTSRSDALRLRDTVVSGQLDTEFLQTPSLSHLLIMVEPLYLLALQRLLDHLDRVTEATIIPDPSAWQHGLTHLRVWGWA